MERIEENGFQYWKISKTDITPDYGVLLNGCVCVMVV